MRTPLFSAGFAVSLALVACSAARLSSTEESNIENSTTLTCSGTESHAVSGDTRFGFVGKDAKRVFLAELQAGGKWLVADLDGENAKPLTFPGDNVFVRFVGADDTKAYFLAQDGANNSTFYALAQAGDSKPEVIGPGPRFDATRDVAILDGDRIVWKVATGDAGWELGMTMLDGTQTPNVAEHGDGLPAGPAYRELAADGDAIYLAGEGLRIYDKTTHGSRTFTNLADGEATLVENLSVDAKSIYYFSGADLWKVDKAGRTPATKLYRASGGVVRDVTSDEKAITFREVGQGKTKIVRVLRADGSATDVATSDGEDTIGSPYTASGLLYFLGGADHDTMIFRGPETTTGIACAFTTGTPPVTEAPADGGTGTDGAPPTTTPPSTTPPSTTPPSTTPPSTTPPSTTPPSTAPADAGAPDASFELAPLPDYGTTPEIGDNPDFPKTDGGTGKAAKRRPADSGCSAAPGSDSGSGAVILAIALGGLGFRRRRTIRTDRFR